MQTFGNKLLDLINETLASALRMVGDDKVTIYTIRDADDEDYDATNEEMFQLPHVFATTKHGFTDEYAVIAVDKEKLYCKGTCDNTYMEDREFTWNDLGVSDLCALADAIEAIIKPTE